MAVELPASGPMLVVILGQSNATGVGAASELTDQSLAAPDASVPYAAVISEDASLTVPPWETYPMGPLEPWYYGQGNHFGVEITLGRDLAAAGPTVVIKRAVSGSTLAKQWAANATYPAPGTGNLAHIAVADAVAAQQACGCSRVVWVWLQGESDALNLTNANAYAANMTAMAALFRETFPSSLFAVGQLNADFVNAPNGTGANAGVIRDQEAAFVAGNSNAVLVDLDSVIPVTSHTHYDANGYAALGHLFATAITARPASP